MIKKIETVLIDDEENSIELLKIYLNKCCPLIKITGTANSVKEGIKIIDKKKPQLIFLDIELGNGTGFDILDKLTHVNFNLIFVTSHEEYAVKAFKYSALDYILKPINQEELYSAVNKSIDDIEDSIFTKEEQIQILNNSIYNKPPSNFIAIPSVNEIEFISLTDIVYLKSEGRYTNFILNNGKKIIASRNLGEYENILDKSMFFRIHHSYIINFGHVELITKVDGQYCKMSNNEFLPIAKRRQDSLSRFLRIK